MTITKRLFSVLLALAFTCTANANLILDITFDDFPGETRFGVWEPGADTSAPFEGIAYDGDASSPIGFGDGFVFTGDFAGVEGGPWQFVWDLEEGIYTFAIFDSALDGICCGFGLGSYSLSYDGNLLVEGGDFGESEFTTVVVPGAEPSPVSAPSVIALLGFGLIGLRLTRRKFLG
jgi:hypothetical protein